MTYYIRNGNTFKVTAEAELDIHTTLPVGNYLIKEDPFGNMYFELVDSFEFTGKRYGDNIRNTERIMSTYLNRAVSTGVMLAGEKGSGKSLLAKMISIEAVKYDIPTIIINSPWCGDKFNKLVQDLEQPAVILFDEFEKVYDRDEQELILTLLDGVFPTKKLFVLTCNDKYKVDSHMRNRPGRIYYMINFEGLEVDFIREYCYDNLQNTDHIQTICNVSSLFANFNFDMLKAMVEEMNRYGESPQEVMKILNISPEFSERDTFDVSLTVEGNKVTKADLYETTWTGNPLSTQVAIEYREHSGSNDDSDWVYSTFKQTDLKKVNAEAGTFTFINVDKDVLVLEKQKAEFFNFYNAF